MVNDLELNKLVSDGIMTKDIAARYLNIYVGEAQWHEHIDSLYKTLSTRYAGDREAMNAELKRSISCAILLPTVDRAIVPAKEHPEKLLFGARKFDLYNKEDWLRKLRDVVERDLQITQWRSQAMSLGFIDPIEYQPYTRQAFNWMYNMAEESGSVTPESKDDVTAKLRRMVWAYGGMVISYIFANHKEVLSKVVNWRTGYFFEHTIFDVYDINQVMKIKKTELQKTSQKLVRTFRID